MKYIASCSFGKDSLATVILAKIHGEPLDEIVYVRVMFDDNTSAEVPEHDAFIQNIAIPKLKEWGYKVTVLYSDRTFMDCFYRVRSSGANEGKYVGFPIPGRCDVQRDCKLRAIKAYQKEHKGEDITQYLGIAIDEPNRLARLKPGQVSLLAKYGVTEKMAQLICECYGLYSPVYKITNRGGCFFCPNIHEPEFLYLKMHHPDLWEKLRKLAQVPNTASKKFNRDYTFNELDEILSKEAKL